ncbi:MAG: cell division protein FtsK [Actinophytocola sp.]|nr:cell division protein FtsK [Actinophytocola sp.]
MLLRRKIRRDSVSVAGLSIFDPVHLGVYEDGYRADIELIYRQIILGGEPGAGKSGTLNNVVAHGALSPDVSLWLLDGKQVELGLWREVADVFVGPDIDYALTVLEHLQSEMDRRYAELERVRRRKIEATDPIDVIMLVIDELALFSATMGSKEQQEQFVRLLRDLVARGRAAGVIVVAATQRPSADIIPTSLRDLFGYRLAFRCTTDSSSDIILGRGWSSLGYNAATIGPNERGVGYLLAEGDTPRRMKSAYLTDAHIYALVEHAQEIRTRNAA